MLCKYPNCTVDRNHLLHCQAISKMKSNMNSQLSFIGMQGGNWKTSKNLDISYKPTDQPVLMVVFLMK